MKANPFAFGDEVWLTDGRTGVITFVDGPWLRFVQADCSKQASEWIQASHATRVAAAPSAAAKAVTGDQVAAPAPVTNTDT